ncbi:hypothetical protein A2U01_0020651, partial [Trifolium medium]|nr:hypothetical protein [Trifolium medium]
MKKRQHTPLAIASNLKRKRKEDEGKKNKKEGRRKEKETEIKVDIIEPESSLEDDHDDE